MTSNRGSTPWLQDPDVTLYHGDVLATLRELPAESVDCVVTSPPYWGLRDYGAEGQLGLEPTPDQYVERMVEVFREVRRVLAAHGTVWLNLGDSYSGGGGYAGDDAPANAARIAAGVGVCGEKVHQRTLRAKKSVGRVTGLKPKDLVGIPWRVAFALQADGWYLRSDIVWAKPNPMPESVTDRPTKAHEYVFLLSKQPRYFFDQEAVREKAEWNRWGDQTNGKHEGSESAAGWIKPKSREELNANRSSYRPGATTGNTLDGHQKKSDAGLTVNPAGRNIRSVWDIATQPYADAHFATFPEELARRCIAAGCPEQVCRVCGKARERIVDVESSWRSRAENGAVRGNLAPEGLVGAGTQRAVHGAGVSHDLDSRRREVVGLTDCGHSDYRPGITLDPFVGSGTVAYVARKLGRHAVGIDLNESYLQLAAKRLQQQSLFAEVPSGL